MEIYRFGNEVAFGVWNLRIETEKNKFIAQFHDSGWFHTINEPFETAAIVSRSSIYDDDFKKIKIEDSFKKNIPLADVLYWLTGGNRVWLFDTEPNIVGEYPAEFTVEYYGKQLSEAILQVETFYELVMALRKFYSDVIADSYGDYLVESGVWFDDEEE